MAAGEAWEGRPYIGTKLKQGILPFQVESQLGQVVLRGTLGFFLAPHLLDRPEDRVRGEAVAPGKR